MIRRVNKFRCVLHGSFNKHFDLIQKVHDIFTKAGIEVIAPKKLEISSFKGNFALFEEEENLDPRFVELLYLHNLKSLGRNGFSYFVNPEGYIDKSTSYELGIAQLSNVHCLFYESLEDHPAYIHKNSVWKPEALTSYISEKNSLPPPIIVKNEKILYRLWEDLMVPGSIVAAGAIIEYQSEKQTKEKEILLVKTHKWGGKYSMVGGRVRRNERFIDALVREVKEETGLNAKVGRHICTFDQIENSGYYQQGTQHLFVDNIVKATSKRVNLNDEAQDYVWIPAKEALDVLDIEPNAQHTIKKYLTIGNLL